MLINNRIFVYPANPGKESTISGRRSGSARPDACVVKCDAAMRSDAVVADERVDSPPVEKSRRGPKALADQDPRPHAFKNPDMQARSSAFVAELHDVALRELQPSRV